MDNFEDGYEISMPSMNVSYSSILKELTETLIIMATELAPLIDPEVAKDITTRTMNLLHIELQIQQTYQADQVSALKEFQAKKNIKSTGKVVPIKGDK